MLRKPISESVANLLNTINNVPDGTPTSNDDTWAYIKKKKFFESSNEEIKSAASIPIVLSAAKDADAKLKKLGSIEKVVSGYTAATYANDETLLQIHKAIRDIQTAVEIINRYK